MPPKSSRIVYSSGFSSQEEIDDFIDQEAKLYGFKDTTLLKAIQRVESPEFAKGNDVVSEVGARGIMHVTPSNFKAWQRAGKIPADATIDDPRYNLRAAIETLIDQHRMNKTPGKVMENTLAGYNNGNDSRKRWGTAEHDKLPLETQEYPSKVLAKKKEIEDAERDAAAEAVQVAASQTAPASSAPTTGAGFFDTVRSIFSSLLSGGDSSAATVKDK